MFYKNLVLFDRITELFYISNSWVPCSNVHIQLWSLRKDFHWYLQFCFIFPCKTFSWISKNRFFFRYCYLIEVLFFFVNFEIIIHQTVEMRSSTRNDFLHYITVYKSLFLLVLNDLKWEVVVCGIVDHHCLILLFHNTSKEFDVVISYWYSENVSFSPF